MHVLCVSCVISLDKTVRAVSHKIAVAELSFCNCIQCFVVSKKIFRNSHILSSRVVFGTEFNPVNCDVTFLLR